MSHVGASPLQWREINIFQVTRGQIRRRRRAKKYVNVNLNENSANNGDRKESWIIMHTCVPHRDTHHEVPERWTKMPSCERWQEGKTRKKKNNDKKRKSFMANRTCWKLHSFLYFSISCWVGTFVPLHICIYF